MMFKCIGGHMDLYRGVVLVWSGELRLKGARKTKEKKI